MGIEKELSFIDKIKKIPSIPVVILDLMALLNDQSTTIKDIITKLKVDQGLTTHILKCCNSALFGVRREINSIVQAVNLLGFLNLKSILMSHFVGNLYSSAGKNDIINDLWKHSVAVGVFAKELANHMGWFTLRFRFLCTVGRNRERHKQTRNERAKHLGILQAGVTGRLCAMDSILTSDQDERAGIDFAKCSQPTRVRLPPGTCRNSNRRWGLGGACGYSTSRAIVETGPGTPS